MTHLLEIGPGSSPIISDRPDRCDWADFSPAGQYTAVQPASWRDSYIFPESLRRLSRVTLIESAVEYTGLADNQFDIVYAKDVLCDPGVHSLSIVDHALRLARPGGRLVFLDISSPRYAPPLDGLNDYLSKFCDVMHSEELVDTNPNELYAKHTDSWVAATSEFNSYSRQLLTSGSSINGSRFSVYRKQ